MLSIEPGGDISYVVICRYETPDPETPFQNLPACWRYVTEEGNPDFRDWLHAGQCIVVQWWDCDGFEWETEKVFHIDEAEIYVNWRFDEGLILTPLPSDPDEDKGVNGRSDKESLNSQ